VSEEDAIGSDEESPKDTEGIGAAEGPVSVATVLTGDPVSGMLGEDVRFRARQPVPRVGSKPVSSRRNAVA
jgi:hypothetical protein